MSRPAFTAQYATTCPECGDEIVADLDRIVMTDGGAVHEDCASDPDDLTTLPL